MGEHANAEPRAHANERANAEPCAHVGTRADVKSRAHLNALAASVTCAQAKEALVRMGWKPKIAAAAVQAAASDLGAGAEIKPLIIEALRQCPRTAH